MKFHNYKTLWDSVRVNEKARGYESYQNYYDAVIEDKPWHFVASFEKNWIGNKKPYYNVYPSVISMLSKLDLSRVETSSLKPPSGIKDLLVRIPVSSKTNAICENIVITFGKQVSNRELIGIAIDSGKKRRLEIIHRDMLDYSVDVTAHEVFPVFLDEHKYVDDVISATVEELGKTNELGRIKTRSQMVEFVKLICGLCLLGDSPELIQPEVLNADEHKLTGQYNIEALVAKARRRGKYGFAIGKDIERMPHLRNAHLALVWYGPGKKLSKIIMRKGCIVHRKKIEKIPTGYAADEV